MSRPGRKVSSKGSRAKRDRRARRTKTASEIYRSKLDMSREQQREQSPLGSESLRPPGWISSFDGEYVCLGSCGPDKSLGDSPHQAAAKIVTSGESQGGPDLYLPS